MPIQPGTLRIKPPALRPGDTVGIVAPASNLQPELVGKGCAGLRRLGLNPYYKQSIFEQDLYFAGSIKRRALELQEMFERDEVRAVICARGGYGCNYLLPEIDLSVVRSNPKIFVGYSDVTTLLTWFSDAAKLVTFHGPMVSKDFAQDDGVELTSWKALMEPGPLVQPAPLNGVKGLVDGFAEGRLYGGCLSLLVASLGTPYEIRTEGTLLFLEDVNCKPYQIDRMLMQLILAGKLEGVRGLIFGEMLNCRQSPDQPYTLEEVILRLVGHLKIPVAYGFPSGHVARQNRTLPLGVNATLRATRNSVQLSYESPVSVSAGVQARSS
jgi:muramoyltetrapeptide carboxypeptidase